MQPKLKEDVQEALSWVDHLEKVALFQEMGGNEEALRAFSDAMEERVYQPNSKIIVEGDTSAELFILIRGEASVYKRTPEGEKFKVARFEGQNYTFFGEGGLLGADQRSATIVSDTECHCLVLGQKAFEALGNRHPDWVLTFYRKVAGLVLARQRKTNHDLMTLYKALVDEIRGN